MLFQPLAASGNLDAFYGTTATILSAMVIASVLEVRTLHKALSDDGGHIKSRGHKVALSVLAGSVLIPALGLVSIPGALLSGSPTYWAEPDTLTGMISITGITAVSLPALYLALIVWDGPGARPAVSAAAAAAPASAPAPAARRPQDCTPAACLLGLGLVAAALATRRPRSSRLS